MILIVDWTSPRARPHFVWGLARLFVFVILNVLSVVLLLRSTRPSSESQSQGDSRECSLLDRFPLRERGRVAESPSVVLGGSSRSSRVDED